MMTSEPKVCAPMDPEADILISPREPSAGALGTFTKYKRVKELKAVQDERSERIWEVRAIISDTVPLSGGADHVLARQYHFTHSSARIRFLSYVHSEGRNAVYYELVGDADNKLTHITIRVKSRLPSNALLLARKPMNVLLDILTRDSNLPLVIQRLELISPTDGAVLIAEMLIPERKGLKLGPLGSVIHAPLFAPYDALYREALVSASPFYRLLCAWKIYEGMNQLRRQIKDMCKNRKVTERMPPDPKVDVQELINLGFGGNRPTH